MVGSLAGDPDGNLWIGTDGGGLNRLNGDRVTRFGAAEGLSNNRVTALLAGRDGGLWVGTYGGGLDRLRGDRFTVYGAAEGLGSPLILALTEDRKGALWVGADGGGLVRFEDGRFTDFTTRDGLADDTVYRSQASAVITVSVGVSSATPADEAGAPSLVARADEALYKAKQTGRNRVCIAEPPSSSRSRPDPPT